VANVAHQRQRVSAGGLDLCGGSMDGALQLRVRLIRLRGNGDVGAVRRGPQCNGQADAARAATDEKGLAVQGVHCVNRGWNCGLWCAGIVAWICPMSRTSCRARLIMSNKQGHDSSVSLDTRGL